MRLQLFFAGAFALLAASLGAGCSVAGSPDAKALCNHALNHLTDCGKIRLNPESIDRKCSSISTAEDGKTSATDLWCVSERAQAEDCIKADTHARKCYMQLDRSSDFYQHVCCSICPEKLQAYYNCLEAMPPLTALKASATAAKAPL